MERFPEQHQLMDDYEQAKAYTESDFTEPHNAFVAHFKERFPEFTEGLVLDIGCGNADPTIRFAKALPNAKLIGLDGSEAMLKFAREAVLQEDLTERIQLNQCLIGEENFPDSSFDAIICNSLLHHLDKPKVLWESIKKLAKPNTPIFVMDLTRPPSHFHANDLVLKHAQGAPEQMRRDFFNSLLAAYRPEEVRTQLDEAGLPQLRVEVVSDRHMVVHGRI